MNEEILNYGKFIINNYYSKFLYRGIEKIEINNGKSYGILSEEESEIIGNFIIECANELFEEYVSKIISKLSYTDEQFFKNLAVSCTILAFKTITAHDWGETIHYDGLKRIDKNSGVDYDQVENFEFELMENTDYMSCRKVLDKMYKVENEDPFLFEEIPEHLFPRNKKSKKRKYPF
jgi:hypothetical protein